MTAPPSKGQYETWCQTYGTAVDQPAWRELWDALKDRSNWRLDPPEGAMPPGPAWCFGPPPNTSHLVLTVADGQYVLYRADTDRDTRYKHLAEVLAWLDGNEAEHLEYTEGERAMIEHLLGEGGMTTNEEG